MVGFFIFWVKIYQKIFSPRTGFLKFIYFSPIFSINLGIRPGCRQSPSCSDYCIKSIKENGVFKGFKMSCYRIINCR